MGAIRARPLRPVIEGLNWACFTCLYQAITRTSKVRLFALPHNLSHTLAPSTDICAPRKSWQIQRTVVFALFLREIKTRFGGRWMGIFWVLLEPLAHVLLMMAMFGVMHRAAAPGIEYPVFLVTGLLPFFAFKGLALRLMDAVDSNRGLFGYRQVKPMDALLSRALLETALNAVVYLIALALLGWIGFQFLPARPLELMATGFLLLVLGAALGTAFAVATNELPQTRSFIRIAAFPLYMLSGVIFPVHAIPADYHVYLLWNPVLHLIELSRASFFSQYVLVQGINIEYPLAWCLLATMGALSLYRVRRLSLIAIR